MLGLVRVGSAGGVVCVLEVSLEVLVRGGSVGEVGSLEVEASDVTGRN